MGRHKDLIRRLVLRVLIGVSEGLDRVLSLSSTLGNPAIFDAARFPWTQALSDNWPAIRDEIMAVVDDGRRLPPLHRISPDHDRIATDDRWRMFFLVGYGERNATNAHMCPVTDSVVSRIPGLQTVTVSVLEPGAVIPPHVGVTKAIITCHLALAVPKERERCRILVDGTPYAWREGEVFVFDDMARHEVENATDERRVVLLMHIKRPVARWAAPLRDGGLWLIRKSPFVQDAKRRIDAWAG